MLAYLWGGKEIEGGWKGGRGGGGGGAMTWLGERHERGEEREREKMDVGRK